MVDDNPSATAIDAIDRMNRRTEKKRSEKNITTSGSLCRATSTVNYIDNYCL